MNIFFLSFSSFIFTLHSWILDLNTIFNMVIRIQIWIQLSFLLLASDLFPQHLCRRQQWRFPPHCLHLQLDWTDPIICFGDLKYYWLSGLMNLKTLPQPEKFIFDSENSAIGILNSEHTLLIRLDQFLMRWLLSSILEHMLGHVIHCQTAAEVWKTLDQIFSAKSKARILQLRLSLQTIKKGLGSIED